MTLEISQLINQLANDLDPVNYIEKLQQLNRNLQEISLISIDDINKSSEELKCSIDTSISNEVCIDNNSTNISHSYSQGKFPHTNPMQESQGILKSSSTLDIKEKNPITATITSSISPKNNNIEIKEMNLNISSINNNKDVDIIDIPHDNTDIIDNNDDDIEEECIEIFENILGWDDCINTSMSSAAHHAAFYGYHEVLNCLCKYFDCFIMDKKGRTPLFYAALQNQLTCIAILVSLEPLWIDVGDEKGDTSLHAAAIANGIEVLEFLLTCEAQPDTANYSGLTPSHLARSLNALVILHKAGAQLYCVDNKSRMPLWFACTEG